MAKVRQQTRNAPPGRRRRGAAADGASRPPAWMARVRPLALLRGVLAIALVGGVLLTAYRVLDVPVVYGSMEGPFRRVSYGEVEAIMREEGPVRFLSADLDHLRGRLEELPWVDVARVRRVFPDRLFVKITEQEVEARWGERGLVNSRGEVFVEDSPFVLPELARLDGPPGRAAQVFQRYLDYRGKLKRLGFQLQALSVDARGAWNAHLASADGSVVEVRLGRRDPMVAWTASRRPQAPSCSQVRRASNTLICVTATDLPWAGRRPA